MKVNINNPCIICGSRESTLENEWDYPDYFYPGKFCYRRCDGCGLLFNSPRLKEKQIEKLYDDNYYFFQRDDESEFQRIVQVYLRTIALIEKNVNEKKVLEVGSAQGYLLALLKNLGWEVQGVEISLAAVDYAERHFAVPTSCGFVEDFAQKTDAAYPVVMAIDVIEHVTDPITFLQSLYKLTSENGYLIIDTPNGNAANINTIGAQWDGFNIFHIFIFSEQVLTKLLLQMGYAVEITFSYGNEQKEKPTFPKPLKKSGIQSCLKNILTRLGLLGAIKRLWRRLIRKKEKNNRDEYLAKAAAKIKSGDYFDSADHQALFAKEKRGDNIVMIAKKVR